MKNLQVQRKLDKLSRRFQNVKKFKPDVFLNSVIDAMEEVGGMSGLRVAANQPLTLRNHTAHYNLPIRYEEHSARLSAQGKRNYAFLEGLMGYLEGQEVSPQDIEYHLGKGYSSKHHQPSSN
ncbi:MAG: hypothetical protein QF632_00730 [Candidatus Woesearchaeota archaeon]|jgi:hypothetical protein|nr:hypothetical protein [Candidatus Woesearchaeota archaeon]MDP7323265.1 hypothetical protein [Candidatus Woesearchaeota archaeon]MDP7457770.1 hypothetical protein [Candidatus Woesearchaeota archaeon]